MKRKVLSLLLCGLLACSMLTACGGSDDSAKSGVESDVEVSKDDETGNKVEDDSNVSSEENSTIEPSIYTELTIGESSLEDTLSYLYSVTAEINESSVTGQLSTAYGKFILDYEGEAFFDFFDRTTSSYGDTLNCISAIKIPYSDSDDLKEKGDALISYFDKLYTRGVYVKNEDRFPAYLVKDSADYAIEIVIYPQHSDERGYFIEIEMNTCDTLRGEKYTKYDSSDKNIENMCWFDENGNVYQPEFWKANFSLDNIFNNIDEANIDLYNVHVKAPVAASPAEEAPAE